MADVGRPTKFTEETREKVYELVKQALPYRYVAAGAGISTALLQMWLKRGRELQDKIENTDLDYDSLTTQEKEYFDFIVRFEQTEADLLNELLEGVKGTDRKWLLTKRFKENYDDMTNINLSGNVGIEHSWKDIIENAKKEDNE